MKAGRIIEESVFEDGRRFEGPILALRGHLPNRILAYGHSPSSPNIA